MFSFPDDVDIPVPQSLPRSPPREEQIQDMLNDIDHIEKRMKTLSQNKIVKLASSFIPDSVATKWAMNISGAVTLYKIFASTGGSQRFRNMQWNGYDLLLVIYLANLLP